jgi:site-specific recombinase XerD
VLPAIAPESLSRAFIRDAARATVVRGEVEVHVGGHMHLLRHTYISHLVRRGVPLRTVQIYAGHASYTTTEQYAYLAPGIAPAAVTELSL